MKITLSLLIIFSLIFGACGTDNSQNSKNENTDRKDISKVMDLLKKNQCNTCHKVSEKLIGPSYQDIAARKYSQERIIQLIYNPEPSNWEGYPPMLPMKNVPVEDAKEIADWIISLQ